MPSRDASFTSTPASSSTRVVSMSPFRAANRSGVKLRFDPSWTFAPRAINVLTISVWPSAAAHISAVWPAEGSLTLTSAPASSSAVSTSRRPVRAAVINGVSPVRTAVLGLAPARKRRVTSAALPFLQANERGVTPKSFVALASAPAAVRSDAISTEAVSAAQWSGVAPSRAGALTSIFCRINARTTSTWPRLTASTSRRSSAVAARPEAASMPSASHAARRYRLAVMSVLSKALVSRLYSSQAPPSGEPALRNTAQRRAITRKGRGHTPRKSSHTSGVSGP